MPLQIFSASRSAWLVRWVLLTSPHTCVRFARLICVARCIYHSRPPYNECVRSMHVSFLIKLLCVLLVSCHIAFQSTMVEVYLPKFHADVAAIFLLADARHNDYIGHSQQASRSNLDVSNYFNIVFEPSLPSNFNPILCPMPLTHQTQVNGRNYRCPPPEAPVAFANAQCVQGTAGCDRMKHSPA